MSAAIEAVVISLSHGLAQQIPALHDDIAAFLQSTNVIDWKQVEVRRKSDSLMTGASTVNEKVRALFEWVRDEIPHSKDADLDVVTCNASEVLKAGTGICYAKSHLFVALLRAQGIPAGFCYQVHRRDPPLNGMVLHGLSGVYMEEDKEWLLLDPRGNTNVCNAQVGGRDEGLASKTNGTLANLRIPRSTIARHRLLWPPYGLMGAEPKCGLISRQDCSYIDEENQ